MPTITINDIDKISRNLWKHNGKYYRLFGYATTPNGCWVIAPRMIELIDIDVATGCDIYGTNTLEFNGITGTVSAQHEFLIMI